MHDQVHIRMASGSRFLRQLSVFIVIYGSLFTPKCEPRHQMHDQVHIRLAPGSRFLRQLSVFIVLDGSRQNVNLVTRCMIRFTFVWHQVHVF